MGRHSDVRGINDKDRALVELEDTVRVRYQVDPVFHAQVQAGARVLTALFPDLPHRDAVQAARLALAAAQPPRGPSSHALGEDHNADPVCSCGWEPVDWTGLQAPTRENGRAAVRRHIDQLKPTD